MFCFKLFSQNSNQFTKFFDSYIDSIAVFDNMFQYTPISFRYVHIIKLRLSERYQEIMSDYDTLEAR